MYTCDRPRAKPDERPLFCFTKYQYDAMDQSDDSTFFVVGDYVPKLINFRTSGKSCCWPCLALFLVHR